VVNIPHILRENVLERSLKTLKAVRTLLKGSSPGWGDIY
jgi:hypothetical protein